MSRIVNRALICLWLILVSYASTVTAADPSPEYKDLFSMSLEELSKVTTLSRSEESRDLAPGSIYVFDAKTIRQRGYRSLGDLLRTVPGFTTFHKGLHLAVGVRGLNANENEKVTLLINGRESNNVQEPDFLNGPINLQTLERVEVVVGPSSFFQRANTLAATVNIITKKAEGVELSIASGTDTPYSANVVAGKYENDNDFITGSLTIERKDGFDAWDESNKPTLAGNEETGQLDQSFFGILEGQSNDWWGQVVAYKAVHPELSLNSRLNPDDSRIYDDATYLDQMFLINLKHHMDITEYFSLDTWFDAGYKEVDRSGKHDAVGPGLEVYYAQRDYSGEFALEYSGIDDHYIYTGLQFAYEDNLENTVTRNGITDTLIGASNDSHSVGIYIYDRWQVTDNFKTEGGLRYDDNSLLDGHARNWGGRFALTYDSAINKKPWISKLITNRAVRYPSAIAALNEFWGTNNPSPPVYASTSTTAEKPEILTTIEWQNIFYWQDTRLSVNIYYQQLKDFISWYGPHTNVGDFSGRGIEFDIRHSISGTLSLWANAAAHDSVLTQDDSANDLGTNDKHRILGSPVFTMNVGFDAELSDCFNLSGQFRYFTDQAAFNNDEGEYVEIDNQTFIDLSATYLGLYGGDIDLGLSVQNLLDNRDHVAVQWQKNQYKPRGRTLLLDIKTRFK
ncbi:MAG: TonB-dependent receptor [Flavobacteriales bacterium]|nr:TonB-dependent receptor [Flavobacteriales bacterium]